MSDEECRAALGSRHVGRAAVQTDSGPHIVPVNYAIAGNSLFFRASAASVLGQNACAGTVAFEIDELDASRHRAWSVLVRGPVVHAAVVGDDAATSMRVDGTPAPAVGRLGRELYELRWRELSGRWTETDGAGEADVGVSHAESPPFPDVAAG